jgi:hypothetical protein
MTPPIEVFPASQLPYRVMVTVDGKRRKGPTIDLLRDCELKEISQYKCYPDQRNRVVCEEVVRLFRK